MGDSDSSGILKKNGLKVTKNREHVLSVLRDSLRPLNHQEIMEKLPKDESWDRVTIYRALSDLEEKNILSVLHATDRVTYFELNDSEEKDSAVHGHKICNTCGKIECIDSPWEALPGPNQLKGFLVSTVEVVFRGLCRTCQ